MRTPRLFWFALAMAGLAGATARPHGTGGFRGHWSRLAAGQSHACAISDDGRASCWGANFSGQVGDGTVGGSRSSPVAVANLPAVVSLAAGNLHTCAITYNSTVSCWGSNEEGQLGNAAGGTGAVPVQGLDPDVVAIGAANERSCAVRVNGSVWCWGSIPTSASGNGVGFHNSPTPTQVIGLFAAVAVVGGFAHTCALQADGTVRCWGANASGQVGVGGSGTFLASPFEVGPFIGAPGARPVDLSAGRDFTCVRLSDGSVNCWGDNSVGQLGTGNAGGSSSQPVAVTLSQPAVALAAGDAHVCAMLANGTVECWGSDSSGQLGDGHTHTLSTSPGPPVPNVVNALEIEAGEAFTCLSRADGTVQCWGDNFFGQHGDGNTNTFPLPDFVSGFSGTPSARAVAAGSDFTCALRGSGATACWGSNAIGQIGQPGAPLVSPNPITLTTVSQAIGLSAGDAHACAVDAAGNAKCWGNNSAGQLGNGTSGFGNPDQSPVAVQSGGVAFTSVSAGFQHTCGVTAAGLVLCWGANGVGQLGTGNQSPSLTPVPVSGIANAIEVAAGNSFTCALTADGSAFCWGDNSHDQLGDNAAESFSKTPTRVLGLASIVAITAGKRHACALFGVGFVACWGDNSRGQIGNNSTQPSAVQTGTGIVDGIGISAGSLYTCASRTFGTASCWGSNSAGELAASDAVDHLTPTHVIDHFTTVKGVNIPIPLVNAIAITAGKQVVNNDFQQTCTLQLNGGIFCWGANEDGQVGDGTTFNRPHPTVVNSFTANVETAATLNRNGRIATVTALINCPTGALALLTLTLQQDTRTGTGHSVVVCGDRLARDPMTIPAFGPSPYQPGSAVATIEALVIDRGAILEDQHWTKTVVLSAEP